MTRVSDANLFLDALRNIQANRAGLYELQAKLSSGKRLLSAAEDPAGAARTLRLRRGLGEIDQFQRNIDVARTRLTISEGAMTSITDLASRLRELAVSADSPDEANFDKIQAEVESLFSELLSLSNTNVGGSYVFAGFNNQQAAFTLNGAFPVGATDPLLPDGVLAGDAGEIRIQIGEASTVVSNITGAALFKGDFDGDGATDAGRVDLFAVVRELRNRLQDPAGSGRPSDSLADLDTALDQVVELRARAGATLRQLDLAQRQLEDLGLTLETERSALEDVDLAEASVELADRERIYQASLAVTARVIQPTLLEFLG